MVLHLQAGKRCGLGLSKMGWWGGDSSRFSPSLSSPSPQVEYLLKKICTAMNVELNSCELDDYLSQEPQGQGGLTVWQFLDMVNSGRFLRGIEQEAVSMAVEEVYQEVIEDVLKQARSPHVLGHKPRPAPTPVLIPVSLGCRATSGRRAS